MQHINAIVTALETVAAITLLLLMGVAAVVGALMNFLFLLLPVSAHRG